MNKTYEGTRPILNSFNWCIDSEHDNAFTDINTLFFKPEYILLKQQTTLSMGWLAG